MEEWLVKFQREGKTLSGTFEKYFKLRTIKEKLILVIQAENSVVITINNIIEVKSSGSVSSGSMQRNCDPEAAKALPCADRQTW